MRSFAGGTVEDDPADLEEIDAVRQVQRDRRVLLDEEDAHAFARVDLAEDPVELLHDERSETEGRLVQEHEARLRHQRTGHREHLLLAAGERSGLLAPTLGEPGEIPIDCARRTPRARSGRDGRLRGAGSPRSSGWRTCRGLRARARRPGAQSPRWPGDRRAARRRRRCPCARPSRRSARSRVVLPAPLAPRTTVTPPPPTSTSTSWRTSPRP